MSPLLPSMATITTLVVHHNVKLKPNLPSLATFVVHESINDSGAIHTHYLLGSTLVYSSHVSLSKDAVYPPRVVALPFSLLRWSIRPSATYISNEN
jgi:hypothetical protein